MLPVFNDLSKLESKVLVAVVAIKMSAFIVYPGLCNITASHNQTQIPFPRKLSKSNFMHQPMMETQFSKILRVNKIEKTTNYIITHTHTYTISLFFASDYPEPF